MLASRVRAAAQIGRAVYQRRHALPMPLQVRTLDCCCRVHAASPLKHSPLLRGLTSAASTAQPQTTKATTSDASDDTRTAPHQASAHTAAADGASSGGESHHSSSPPSSLFGRVLSALVLVPIFYLVNDQFFGISTVQGSSMSPTLNPGAVPGQPWASTRDVVLVWKFGRNRFAYRRGEVVVLTSPSNPRLRTTKRLIGLERDWIAEQGGSGAIVRPRRHRRLPQALWTKRPLRTSTHGRSLFLCMSPCSILLACGSTRASLDRVRWRIASGAFGDAAIQLLSRPHSHLARAFRCGTRFS